MLYRFVSSVSHSRDTDEAKANKKIGYRIRFSAVLYNKLT